MKRSRFQMLVVSAGLTASLAAAVLAQKPATAHIAVTAAEVTWGAPPPSLSPGAKFAVVSGDPGGKGPFTIRLQMPPGYRIAPHWHPTDEHVTVVSGVFALGMGEKFDPNATKELPAGSYAALPAEMRHFALAKTAAVVQVHGMGPFVFTYVNPTTPARRRSEPMCVRR